VGQRADVDRLLVGDSLEDPVTPIDGREGPFDPGSLGLRTGHDGATILTTDVDV
jgi:hypothetical protein